jgi:hypothetical protein
MGAPVHLPFLARGMVDGWGGPSKGFWSDGADIILKDGIAALIAESVDLFEHPYGREMFFANQIAYFGFISIQLAGSFIRGRGIGP